MAWQPITDVMILPYSIQRLVCPRIVSTDVDDLWLLAEWH
jgi:hypothetical protein